ncbi:RNA-binding protein 48 [Anthonomus grandis grandis]|uniref:RNA-binding protein 48 n=1 Tax=Anthonomus grandis grandis TaxID=2921223 RepID=UPI002166908D|nr:RNA-binding protein 48 [Anthonomus grandis grandis]
MMDRESIETLKEINHHKQEEYCTTRPAYRQGRKLTAVKVYTINNESQHLYIYGVPQINLRKELKNLCTKYGEVFSINLVSDVKREIFTECFHIHYKRIQSARVAKRLLDAKSFYGGLLHICYAPECESVLETKAKLAQRKRDVLNRLHKK